MTDEQVFVDPDAQVAGAANAGTHEVAPDLAYQRLLLVNVVYFGAPRSSAGSSDRQWVLIDAGIMGSSAAIRSAATRRFGDGSRPAAIMLTHGHFDHVGVLEELADRWDVPIYAHELEFPYLNGSASYPRPDPSVGGGLMSTLARFYPRGPINVSQRLQPLPAYGTLPAMPGWRWVHVPGHTPGQVAFWRESDRTLLAADAFITTKQESAYAVLTQQPELHGPPMYYTQNWVQARHSVQQLAALKPELVVTGHGPALQGVLMRSALHTLAHNFDRVAVPDLGHYVDHPTSDTSGTAYPPPTTET